MAALALILAKASVLLLLALAAAHLLRRAPAILSHRLWTGLFAALLVLPCLAFVLPAIDVPIPARWTALVSPSPPDGPAPTTPVPAAGSAAVDVGAARTAANLVPDASHAAGLATPGAAPAGRTEQPLGSLLLLVVWCAGTLIAAATTGLALWRVRHLVRTADDGLGEDWQRAASAIGLRLGLRRPTRLLVSPQTGTPMAGGTWRPFVVLPPSARTWDAERRDVVLAHELAHLAERDPIRHLLARVALAAYWFHPLAWLAARRASVAREQACDAAVVALGTRPSAYARVLLELAEGASPRPVAGALPMVERSLLETRLMAILNHDRRPAIGRLLMIPVVGVALLTIPVAAVQPAGPAARAAPVVPVDAGVIASPAATGATAAAPPIRTAPAQTAGTSSAADLACWARWSGRMSFSGSLSTADGPSGREIVEQIGRSGEHVVVETRFGDLRVCMVADDPGQDASRPSVVIDRARHVVLEARQPGIVQQLVLDRQSGGSPQVTWQVNGATRPVDAAATTWRQRMLAVLDTTWEISTLRGQVSTLHGRISTIHGQRSTLLGQISTLRGRVSTMRGQASTVRGQDSTLRGRISEVHGHVSVLNGKISTERGAISSLDAARAYADDKARAEIDRNVAEHQAAITRIQGEIKDYDADARVKAIEKERADLDVDAKVAAIEAEIKAFDLDGKVAAVQKQIDALDVDGKVAAIQKQIDALDADRRVADLESRRDGQVSQLKQAIAAVGG